MDNSIKDKRIRRTLTSLKNNLIDLMGKKDINKISVTELCESTGISRQTFYFHYNDLNALIYQISNEILADFKHNLGEYIFEYSEDSMNLKTHDNFIRIFQHILKNKTIYESLLAKNNSSPFAIGFKNELKTFITEGINITEANNNTLTFPKDFIIAYSTAAYFEVIIWWIKNDYHYSSEEMASMLLQTSIKTSFK